jgi:hypothetical protein
MADLPKPIFKRHTLDPQLFQRDLVFSSKILSAKYAIVRSQLEYKLITASKVMPRAVLVRDAVILSKLEDHLQYIKRPDFEPQEQVLLERAVSDHIPSPSKEDNTSVEKDVVTIVEYQPNLIELKSSSDSDTYLVLSELFYPGWHAYVDGKKVQIMRANFLLRAIPLKSGQHDIIFVYRPMSFLTGATISLLTLLILGCIFSAFYIKRIIK